MGPNHQSHLFRYLDNTSPIPASTSTSAAASGCSMPRRRGRSGVALLVSTKRTADLHSQVTVDFHSQVSHLSTCLQVHCDFYSQVTHLSTCLQVHCNFHSQVTHLSMCLQVHCDFYSQVTHLSMCLQMHCDFHSQASHLAAVIVPLGTGLLLWHISFRGAVILLVTESARILSLILLDRVALYAFLSYSWSKFLLERARPCNQGATY